MIQKKVCILGAAGVGKTSLTAQFVYSKFSEKYLSTMGVKIDRKCVDVKDKQVNLMIWDIHGEEKYKKIATSYLRGASGIITVIDGTRPDTIVTAKEILQRVEDSLGVIPNVFLVNKVDLTDEWCVSHEDIQALIDTQKQTPPFYYTSAKTGEHVETSFLKLAELLIAS
jgi:small GTP-binding protein